MVANRRYGGRIAWSIVALVLILAVSLALIGRWGPGKSGLVEWMRRASGPRTTAPAAYAQGNWELAADLSRQSLKTRGDDPELLRVYARACARLERDSTATAIYNRLGPAALEPEDSFLLGLAFTRMGNLEKAFEIWHKAAQTGPDRAELLDQLVQLAGRMQRLDEAAEAARQLERLPGWEARGLLMLAEIQELLKNPRGAAAAARKGLELDPEAKGLTIGPDHFRKLLARSSLEIGQPGPAIEALRANSEKTSPLRNDREANWLLSRAFLQTGQTSEALAALKRAGPIRDEHPLTPEPSPYVGESRCASCHPGETRTHHRSRHARTIHHGSALLKLPLPDKPLPDPDDPKVTHMIARDGESIRVETRVDDHVFQSVVAYAFGIPARYVTMIGRDKEKNYRALRLSSYHTDKGIAWGRTSGDVPDSDAVENVRGQPIPERDGVVRCVYCHVTNFRDFRDPPPEDGVGPTAADSGIGCERCHGPGGNHLAAIKARFPDRAIVNVGTASAQTITAQCADCHIVGSTRDIKAAPDDPRFVRSPALTLTFSRCYTDSDGALTCLTCHDPHRDDEQPASFYESKCLACHSSKKASQTTCKVNPAGKCLTCHMPKVPLAVLHSSLTDHYIRVHKSQ